METEYLLEITKDGKTNTFEFLSAEAAKEAIKLWRETTTRQYVPLGIEELADVSR